MMAEESDANGSSYAACRLILFTVALTALILLGCDALVR